MSKSPTLLSPCQVGNITLKNRVVMAPLTRSRAGEERMPNDLMKQYYSQRKSAGLITSEATVISPQGCGWLNSPGIYSDAQMKAWQPITQALHETETPIFYNFGTVEEHLIVAFKKIINCLFQPLLLNPMVTISILPLVNNLTKPLGP